MKDRVGFVDWLRLIASLSMIQGHVIDAVLDDASRVGALYATWSWARGLTAPAFLVASGLSFFVASRLDDEAAYAVRRTTPGARRRRIVRSAWLVVMGTLLHAGEAPWIIDVLQCVGVSLLVLDGVVSLAPRPHHVFAVSGLLAIVAVSLALPASGLSGEGALRYLTSWVSRRDGSLFPLVPWAGYVLAGVLIARVVLPQGTRTPSRTTTARLLALALAAGLASRVLEVTLPAAIDATWSAHPAIVCMRLAFVLGLAALLAVVGARVALPKPLQALAGETLALYVVHLVVLYAAWVGPGRVWARALPLPQALGLAMVMLLLSAVAALGWARAWPPLEARWMPWLRTSGPERGETR